MRTSPERSRGLCRVPCGVRYRFHLGHPRQLHRREATRRRSRSPKTLGIAVASPEESFTNHAARHIAPGVSGAQIASGGGHGFSLAEGTALVASKGSFVPPAIAVAPLVVPDRTAPGTP